MAQYHINTEGYIGRCQAFSDGCAFGEVKHFKSRKEAEAYLAKGSVHPILAPKLKRRELMEVASSSTDPARLMAVALSGSRKAIAAFMENSSVPAAALVEARTKSALALNWAVDLEDHPNYPAWGMTNAGISRKLSHGEATKPLRESIFGRSDAGDQVLYMARFGGSFGSRGDKDALIRSLLSDGSNLVSGEQLNIHAHEDATYAVAAAESGRFPTEAQVRSMGPRPYKQSPKTEVATVVNCIPGVQDSDMLDLIAASVENSSEWSRAKLLLARHPLSSPQLLEKIYYDETALIAARHPSAPLAVRELSAAATSPALPAAADAPASR